MIIMIVLLFNYNLCIVLVNTILNTILNHYVISVTNLKAHDVCGCWSS